MDDLTKEEKNLFYRFKEGFDKVYAHVEDMDRMQKLVYGIYALFITSAASILVAFITNRI